MKKLLNGLLAGVLCAGMAFSAVACGDGDEAPKLQVYMPDGAPALSMAMMMAQDTEDDGFEYHVIKADQISVQVTGKEDEIADFAILPVNMASNLIKIGDMEELYELVGSVTQGNLYLLSANSTESVTKENFTSLEGKTVGVVQMTNFPGFVFKAAIKGYGMTYNELTEGKDVMSNCVNLLGITPQQVGQVNDRVDYYLAFEPNASRAATAAGLSIVGDIQRIYGEGNGYPQAVMIAKKSLIENQPEKVNALRDKMELADDWIMTADPTTVYNAVLAHATEGMSLQYGVADLTTNSIFRSNIRFERSATCKQKIDDLLADLHEVNANITAIPDIFYYLG